MKKLALNRFQQQEFSKYWFNLSTLTIASFVLKFFEPQAPKITLGSIITLFIGLTLAVAFIIIGLWFSKEVKG